MKPKTMILMVVAVGCGLGASYMTSKLLAERNKPAEVEEVPVLVAKVKAPGWTPIKDPKQYFEVRMFRKADAPKRALTSLDELKDQKLNKPIDESKPVSQDDLLSKADLSLQDKLKPGQRAIGIKVTTESAVAGWVLPDTYVDVLCVTRGQDASSKIVLQNVRVLAVDDKPERNPEQKHLIGQTLTVAASAEEIAQLSLAQSVGELRLMLKGAGDSAILPPIVAKLDDLGRSATRGRMETPGPEQKPVARAPETPLPDIKPDVKPEVKPEPPAPAEEPKPVEKAVKFKKPHVMLILDGGTSTKVPFREDPDSDEEDETGGGLNPVRKDERPAPARKGGPKAGPQPRP